MTTSSQPYATPQQVRFALSPDGDPTDKGSASGFADDQLQDAIEDAASEVDANITGETPTLPDGSWPPLVTRLTVAIAAYLATLAFYKGDQLPAGHPALLRYQRAQQLLQALREGRIELVDEGGQPTVAATANPSYDGDLFTPDQFDIRGNTRGNVGAWGYGWDYGYQKLP